MRLLTPLVNHSQRNGSPRQEQHRLSCGDNPRRLLTAPAPIWTGHWHRVWTDGNGDLRWHFSTLQTCHAWPPGMPCPPHRWLSLLDHNLWSSTHTPPSASSEFTKLTPDQPATLPMKQAPQSFLVPSFPGSQPVLLFSPNWKGALHRFHSKL